MIRYLKALVPSVLCILALVSAAPAQQSVLTEHYDNARTGANLNETILNTSNVNANQFGKLWAYTVDGSIYAQPLYVPAVTISGQVHNVLYVATMNDKVYAFDADSNTAPLWTDDFTNSAMGITPVPIMDITGSSTGNITGNVGIESTPVIDPSTKTMYLVARTKENGVYFQRLHALDITTGAEKSGSPVVIQGSVSGTGSGNVGGTITFDPLIQNQRASLALANGMILIAWAAHEDLLLWHGWVMAYSAQNPSQLTIFCVDPQGKAGGVWQSGRAPAVDASGNVYYASGNGDWDGLQDFGESILKFTTTSNTLSLVDWFTPDDWSTLNSNDWDLGSSGPMLIPGTDLLISGGKASLFYVMHSSNLGHEQAGNGQIVQILNNNAFEIKSGPVYWNRATGAGPTMYDWAEDDYLKAYHFNGATFDATPISQSLFQDPQGNSGGVLTLSANGSTPGTGIVWASVPTSQDADAGLVAGTLRAFDANDLTVELWDSNQNSARDNLGNWAKFNPPTVVNGKVYTATSSNAVIVYGQFFTGPDFTISASPKAQYLAPGGSTPYTLSTGVLNAFSGTVNLTVSGLPTGATASFNPASIAGGASSTLTVTTTAGTPAGNSTLTITGGSGSLTHTATVTLAVTTNGLAPATAISLNFVGQDLPLAVNEVAGVVAKSNWNNAFGYASFSPLPLLDENGSNTNATVTWTADNPWALPVTDQPGNVRMMKGYLDNHAGSLTVVTVSGLPSNVNGYQVYVYADGDNGTATRTGNYQISGTGITTTSISLTDAANTDFSGTFTQANNSNGNFVLFSINATGFTITATPGAASDGLVRAPLNGIQIVPVVPFISATSLNYPMQVVGTTSAPQTVTLSNSGIAPVTISNFSIGSANASDFAIQSNTCPISPSTLAAGTNCHVTLTFAPTAAGSRKSGLTITSNAPGSPSTIVLTGVGTVASLSTPGLNFSNQTMGTSSAPQVVTLTNAGSTLMNVWQIAISGPNASDFSKTTTCGSTLGPIANCSVNVTFTPSAVGTRGALLLFSDDGGGSPQAVSLLGNGIASAGPSAGVQGASAQLNTSNVVFAKQTVGTTSPGQSVVFKNAGGSSLSIFGISISGPSRDDFAQTNTCGSSLLPGDSCTITVRFIPRAKGNRTGVTSIMDSAAGSPHSFSMKGIGVGP